MKYVYYGEYSSGLSSYLNKGEKSEDIKMNVDLYFNEVNRLLPEYQKLNEVKPEWLRDNSIEFNEDGTLKVTFITEGAGYQSALCYFIYDIGHKPSKISDINEIYIIFPNASERGSGGYMNPGDTMLLASDFSITTDSSRRYIGTPKNYTFKQGKGVGFILVSNGWRYNYVNTGLTNYSSISSMNPESNPLEKYHTAGVMLEIDTSKIVLGFEDVNRAKGGSDNDFNDCVILLTPSNINFIEKENIVDINANLPEAPSPYDVGWKKAIHKFENGDICEVLLKLLIPKDALQILMFSGEEKWKTNKAYIAEILCIAPTIEFEHYSDKYVGEYFESCCSYRNKDYIYNLYQTDVIEIAEGEDFSKVKKGIYFFKDRDLALNYSFAIGKIMPSYK